MNYKDTRFFKLLYNVVNWIPKPVVVEEKMRLITTKEAIKKYGYPDKNGKYLTSIDLPYPMRLAWNLNQKVTRLRCHLSIAHDLEMVFKDLLDHYGLERIQELRIDVFGGVFAYRKMRGGDDWSRHAFGIAIDLDPKNNKLRWGSDRASFARPEYDKMHEIFEKHGFLNLGKEKGYDFMHWEKAIKN